VFYTDNQFKKGAINTGNEWRTEEPLKEEVTGVVSPVNSVDSSVQQRAASLLNPAVYCDSGEDSFELHSVDLELEAVEKQICNLMVKRLSCDSGKPRWNRPGLKLTCP
ncbi:hypothetical protein QTP86_005290, partial [Hemibagrus guttatus]